MSISDSGFFFLIFPAFTSRALFRRDPLQQLRGRLVVRVLRDELAAHGEVEDGPAQLLDLIGAGGEGREGIQGEAGVVLKGFGIGRVQAGEAGRGQPVARCLPLSPGRFQLVAQGHQFIDLGDDAVLFGKGWEHDRDVRIALVWLSLARVASIPLGFPNSQRRWRASELIILMCETRNGHEIHGHGYSPTIRSHNKIEVYKFPLNEVWSKKGMP